jgi:hypothetical protein
MTHLPLDVLILFAVVMPLVVVFISWLKVKQHEHDREIWRRVFKSWRRALGSSRATRHKRRGR